MQKRETSGVLEHSCIHDTQNNPPVAPAAASSPRTKLSGALGAHFLTFTRINHIVFHPHHVVFFPVPHYFTFSRTTIFVFYRHHIVFSPHHIVFVPYHIASFPYHLVFLPIPYCIFPCHVVFPRRSKTSPVSRKASPGPT